ncbi:MAG: transporter [Pseudomonadota bacterium]
MPRIITLAGVLTLAVASGSAWAQQSLQTPQSPAARKTLLSPFPADAIVDDPRDDHVDPDRPHFPEASTTTGLGRAVLEGGYTFTRNGSQLQSHSMPESLLRVGMFADWFEMRVGQNFLSERRTIDGVTRSASDAQDLYLGAKVALTAQDGVLPAIALIPQMTVPTGASTTAAGRVLPGANADFGWEVVKDRFGIELLVANNQVRDELGGYQHLVATGLTGVVQMSKSLELFAEWDAYTTRAAASPPPARSTTPSAASSIFSPPTSHSTPAPASASTAIRAS